MENALLGVAFSFLSCLLVTLTANLLYHLERYVRSPQISDRA